LFNQVIRLHTLDVRNYSYFEQNFGFDAIHQKYLKVPKTSATMRKHEQRLFIAV
jgi:hypothetical protein